MRNRYAVRGVLPLLALVLAFAPLAARGAEKGARPLEQVLKDFQAGGMKLVYSSALVKPEMLVAETPTASAPAARLAEVLAPFGLKPKPGPDGTVLVVRGPEASGSAGIGVVSNILILSDKNPDVSSIEAWKKSCLTEGMSEKDRALAAWKSCVTYQHQEAPPDEFLGCASQMDPIKIFNVYGYAMCNSASSNVEALSRAAGLQARGRIINSHSVPEVQFDGEWHLLDGSLICYFPKPDGKIASVNELIDGVRGWLAEHPELKGNNDKLYEYMKTKGWKSGPEILRQCAFYDERGWFPAATHGWYSTMQEYDIDKDQIYEYGVAMGYQVNVQLRQGERLVRNWFNKGLHVNRKFGGGKPGCLTQKVGADNLRYMPAYGDTAPGRIGNGELVYEVPLASNAFRGGALLAENLLSKSEGAQGAEVTVKDAAKPGELVLRMATAYVFLQGRVSFDAQVGAGGSIAVAFSENNGLDWKELASVTASGPQDLDLSDMLLRRYNYRVKFALNGAGSGLSKLKLAHDVQHSQRPLPILAEGENTIAFRSGPQEGTITVEGSTVKEEAAKHRVLHYSDFHPVVNNLRDGGLFITDAPKGDITFPIETPGDLTRVRVGLHYRARDKNDGWDILLSYDGQNFTKAGRVSGPTAGTSDYLRFEDVEKGKRKVWVKFDGTSRNATGLLNLRIDADYAEPHGGFAPIKVTYLWEENGQAKQDVHVAKEPNETWKISCGAKPLMKSIVLERAE
ncbi:MAG: hypothetical protein M5U26_25450 [Planctomycetota bacterium]|nr:hypothetical protein [Planctomycetota bacterium]